MNQPSLKSNTNRGSEQWRDEVKLTKQIPGWDGLLIERIQKRIGVHGHWIKRVGRNLDEIQFEFDEPVHQVTEFPELDVKWVQFNTYDPHTKRPATRTIRFSWDTGALMVLVRSPKPDQEGYDYYLLARRKYQLVPQAKIVEFSRGWIREAKSTDIGWGLFRRDFPGLEGEDLTGDIWQTELGDELLANTAEFACHHRSHLILVTLKAPMSKDELQKYLATKSHENVSEPVVMELSEAAKALNAHLEGKDAKEWLFGEEYSINLWSRFLALYGSQFPELLPKQNRLPE